MGVGGWEDYILQPELTLFRPWGHFWISFFSQAHHAKELHTAKTVAEFDRILKEGRDGVAGRRLQPGPGPKPDSNGSEVRFSCAIRRVCPLTPLLPPYSPPASAAPPMEPLASRMDPPTTLTTPSSTLTSPPENSPGPLSPTSATTSSASTALLPLPASSRPSLPPQPPTLAPPPSSGGSP